MEICDGCSLSEFELIFKSFKNNNFALNFFEKHNIVPKEVFCPNCNKLCTFRESKNQFRCRNVIKNKKYKKLTKQCTFVVSKFKGTFLEKSKIDSWKILNFINLFVRKQFCHSRVRENLKICQKSSVDWRSFCSEVCEHWIDQQTPIGGEGKIVEIDETLICRRKYNRGRELCQVWVFGGIERETKKLFLVPLIDQRRDADTLIPLIKKYILPGTIIISDSWKAYSKLSELNNSHKIINHSENFVSPEDQQVHTKNIERA